MFERTLNFERLQRTNERTNERNERTKRTNDDFLSTTDTCTVNPPTTSYNIVVILYVDTFSHSADDFLSTTDTSTVIPPTISYNYVVIPVVGISQRAIYICRFHSSTAYSRIPFRVNPVCRYLSPHHVDPTVRCPYLAFYCITDYSTIQHRRIPGYRYSRNGEGVLSTRGIILFRHTKLG